MNVTAEQLEALKHGLPVPVDVEHEECVLILKETYDEMRQLLEDPRHAYSAVLKAWDKDGSPEDSQLYAE
ncbi:hypothetical protein [Planctomicrobium piriforme]|uniref:Uncharacterized protein n=1 Tax=Planctomicrobium piriforme TaxID=1576369 RepID=A0A1I3F2U6_9PLAN|nr:hypothetical protein [Planctomicrobium piriforme]SFI05566.1 hypothetical protein SAMN05421753_10560 [Planctomicrobium piriforme]